MLQATWLYSVGNIVSLIVLREQYSAEVLHGILSKALGIPLDSTNHLKAIVESNYVLTLDYALKMLAVNERWKCGVPVIIEGETGVGKTALIEVLSKLWNCAIVQVFEKTKKDVIFYLQQALGELEVYENIEVGSSHMRSTDVRVWYLLQKSGAAQ